MTLIKLLAELEFQILHTIFFFIGMKVGTYKGQLNHEKQNSGRALDDFDAKKFQS